MSKLLLFDANKTQPRKVPVVIIDGVESKQCTDCSQTFPLVGFHRSKLGSGGRLSICKTCTNRRRREYRAREPEKHQAWGRNHYMAHREKWQEASLLKNYGISLKQRDEMVAQQDGRCAVCGRLPRGAGNAAVLHVDHDHRTGALRKMLCQDCNNGLGRFLDDPDLLRKAAEYIEAFR